MSHGGRMQTDNLAILTVTGWTNSKASSDHDRGASSLREWLERKAGRPVSDYRVDGDSLQIAVADVDKQRFLHCNGWRWAGVDVTIGEGQQTAPPQNRNGRNQSQFGARGARNFQSGSDGRGGGGGGDLSSRITAGPSSGFGQGRTQQDLFDRAPNGPRGGFGRSNNSQGLNGGGGGGGGGTNSSGNPFGNRTSYNNSKTFPRNDNVGSNGGADTALLDTLTGVIHRRYSANEKFLDFSNLAQDPDITSAGLTSTSADKVWSALFIACEQRVFETFEKRREMVETLSFKGNAISNVREIVAAASTFIKLKNLDLSNNNLKKVDDLSMWRKRFPNLEQIILSGNPVDSAQTRQELRSWYRNLKTYNMVPLDAPFPAATGNSLAPTLESHAPIPSNSPVPGAGPNGTLLTAQQHPEFGPGSDFGLPTLGKSEEQVLKEQMGLKFSYETRLKMTFVEQLLSAHSFNYEAAINEYQNAANAGNVPADAYVQV